MSRGPFRPADHVVETPMGERCALCGRPREEHRLITVQVCYSDKVIKHPLCPAADVDADVDRSV